ncbi:alpha-xenorhabdolysin family binary toxin subunit B [Pseudomonas putida]
MNIYFLKGFDAAPQVDMTAIKTLFKAIREVAGSLDVAFDARVDRGVHDLLLGAINAEEQVRTQFTAIQAGKGGARLVELHARLKAVEATELPEELHQKAMDSIWKAAHAEVGGHRATMDHAAMVLREACSDFDAINYAVRAAELTLDLRMKSNRSEKKLEDEMAALALLRKERETLDATISALEKTKWPTLKLPSPDDLKKFTVPSPELAIIEAGLKLLEQLSGKVVEGMAYVELIHERDELRSRQAQMVVYVEERQALLAELSRKQSCLEVATQLLSQKDDLKTQLMDIAQPLQQFSLSLMAAGQTQDMGAMISIMDAGHTFAESAYRSIR